MQPTGSGADAPAAAVTLGPATEDSACKEALPSRQAVLYRLDLILKSSLPIDRWNDSLMDLFFVILTPPLEHCAPAVTWSRRALGFGLPLLLKPAVETCLIHLRATSYRLTVWSAVVQWLTADEWITSSCDSQKVQGSQRPRSHVYGYLAKPTFTCKLCFTSLKHIFF